MPRYFGFGSRLWDGPTFAEHLRRCYGIDLGLRQCQRLFRQLADRSHRTQSVPVSTVLPMKFVRGGVAVRRP